MYIFLFHPYSQQAHRAIVPSWVQFKRTVITAQYLIKYLMKMVVVHIFMTQDFH